MLLHDEEGAQQATSFIVDHRCETRTLIPDALSLSLSLLKEGDPGS
jgi:hypothetical protein